MVVQYMPTASGMQMLNHLTDRAPKDGTVVGAAVAVTVIDPVGVSEGVAYDPRKLSWIGNVSPQVTACFIRTSHPVKTVDDAKSKEVIVAATSRITPAPCCPTSSISCSAPSSRWSAAIPTRR